MFSGYSQNNQPIFESLCLYLSGLTLYLDDRLSVRIDNNHNRNITYRNSDYHLDS